MHRLSITCNEFVVELSMSQTPYILLEGSQDRSFFDILLQSIQSLSDRPRDSIPAVEISTAESLKSGDTVRGNREKVEEVSQLVEGSPFGHRFVGFVDREFREFKLGGKIEDVLAKQHRAGRLVWSRGHSIENYLLDFDVVRDPLFDCSDNGEVARVALERLQENFPTILNISCALGLAAYEAHELSTLRRTVRWTIFRTSGSALQWDIDNWRRELVNRSKITIQLSNELVRRFEYWLGVVQSSDLDDVRWSCDGHMGMRLIWEAYAKLVFDVGRTIDGVRPNPSNQRDRILRTSEIVKLNHLARSWARINTGRAMETPKVCFDLVGIPSQN